ncbi:MAG: HD domain-containing phosphohydrolase [Pseudomonadota bacterium]
MDELIFSSPQEENWPEGFLQAPAILLVDDEVKILNTLRRLLRPLGYNVLAATSGEDALMTLEHEPIDLVISDMRMPNMDGAQLLSTVKKRWPDICRILLTGYADMASTINVINQAEIYRYIAKPWDDSEILEIIKGALKLRGLEKERLALQHLVQEKNKELEALNDSLEQKVEARTHELADANKELTRVHERVKNSFFMSIKIFSNLIEMRNGSFFKGYVRRIAELAGEIAKYKKLSKAIVQDIVLAGLLSDIGKIGFPDALMTKPLSQFSEEEFELFKKCPVKAAAALIALEDLHNVTLYICCQYERYDGTGFPNHLSGADIPEGAAILAVASDYYAAQLGLRVPNKLTLEEARNWIIEGKGSSYRPDVIEAFIEVTKNHHSILTKLTGIDVLSDALTPGMILDKDIITPEGMILIGAGGLLDKTLIQKIQEFEQMENTVLSIRIRTVNP